MKRMHVAVVLGVVVLIILLTLVFVPKKKTIQNSAINNAGLQQASKLFEQGKFLEAKGQYKKALEEINDADSLTEIQSRIEESSMRVIFSPVIDDCSKLYTVRSKDALIKIAKKHNSTVSLIKRANELESNTIRPRQKLKVNVCEFSIVVDKSQNLLFLKRKGEVVKTYVVSTGKDNGTPIGTFKIVNKLVKPTWFKTGAVISPDSPENILGTRWLGFDLKGYGIHGTTDPDNLGKQITLGCVRMRNEEVEDLYDLIPVGAEVVIVD